MRGELPVSRRAGLKNTVVFLRQHVYKEGMNMKSITSLSVGGGIAIFAIVTLFLLVNFKTIGGNEVAVKETWSEGVINEVFGSKTYMLFPKKCIHTKLASKYT